MLNLDELDQNPIRQFNRWFEAATQANIPQPESMTLSTSSIEGYPSARIVLLKSADEEGFTFFTNYSSRKSEDLEKNPRAALVFFWQPLGRQIRIEGKVERTSRAESEAYFKSRPRESQLGAWASNQSQPIPSRQTLESKFEELRQRHEANEIPCPPHWGGYRVIPESIEFWQLGPHRLHDRFKYTRASAARQEASAWTVLRLAP